MSPSRHRHASVAATLLGAVVSAAVTAQTQRGVESVELAVTLAKASARVEEFFTRAQSLVCTETVHIQPLNYGLGGDGPGRTVESELRLSWEPGLGGEAASEAQTRRQVVKVNGHKPRHNDRNNCTGPEQNETETQPLSMLLESERDDYAFSPAGQGKVDGRAAIVIEFRQVEKVRVDVREVEGNEDCISYDMTGGLRGRVWVDAATSDVLRLDQHLAGYVDVHLPRTVGRRFGVTPIWTLERWDTTMRFKRLTFQEPDEAIVLPVSSTTVRVTRGAGTPRLRTTTTYSGYKRFLTGGRLVPGDMP